MAKLRLASRMLIHFKLDYQEAWPPLIYKKGRERKKEIDNWPNLNSRSIMFIIRTSLLFNNKLFNNSNLHTFTHSLHLQVSKDSYYFDFFYFILKKRERITRYIDEEILKISNKYVFFFVKILFFKVFIQKSINWQSYNKKLAIICLATHTNTHIW